MTEPTGCCRAHSASPAYCGNCDLLVGLEGYHVVAVSRGGPGLVVTIESAPVPRRCPVCGVVAASRGRRVHEVVDTRASGIRCGCVAQTHVVLPRGLLRRWVVHQAGHRRRRTPVEDLSPGHLVGGRPAAPGARPGSASAAAATWPVP